MKFRRIKIPKIKQHNIYSYKNYPEFNGVLLSNRKISLRTKIYGFICIFIVFTLIMSIEVNASVFNLFGQKVEHLFTSITENVLEANSILVSAFRFAQTSPYDIVNGLVGASQRAVAINIRNAILTMSLVIATLLLMVEFFRKTINFEWSSKWENVLIFLVKIIVVKQVVQNADVIIGYIYAMFNTINEAATGGSVSFLPCDNIHRYVNTVDILKENAGFNPIKWLASWIADANVDYYYDISHDAVKMFYGADYRFPSDFTANASRGELAYDLTVISLDAPSAIDSFNPLMETVLLQPYFLIMKAIGYIVFVITIGRVFELSVYTFFAPLPLATFASDTTHEIGKSFIKNYIACVLQVAVIVVMFIVYIAMNQFFTDDTNGYVGTRLIQLVALITLGLGVVKSGAWAKKICGVG